MEMNTSEILLKAAELIDSGRRSYACIAIESVAGFDSPEYRAAFRVFSRFSRNEHIDFSKSWLGFPDERRNKDDRVLALLFAAEIAKDLERNQ